MLYLPGFAVPTPAASPSADPHPALWLEWRRLRDLHSSSDALAGSRRREVVGQELERVSHLLRSTVASTPEGLDAQFAYLTTGILEEDPDTLVEIVVPDLDAFLAELDGLDAF